MKVGDLVVIDRNIWKIEGVYLGCLGQENIIELRCLTMKPGYVSGIGPRETSLVPEQFLKGKVFTNVQ